MCHNVPFMYRSQVYYVCTNFHSRYLSTYSTSMGRTYIPDGEWAQLRNTAREKHTCHIDSLTPSPPAELRAEHLGLSQPISQPEGRRQGQVTALVQTDRAHRTVPLVLHIMHVPVLYVRYKYSTNTVYYMIHTCITVRTGTRVPV